MNFRCQVLQLGFDNIIVARDGQLLGGAKQREIQTKRNKGYTPAKPEEKASELERGRGAIRENSHRCNGHVPLVSVQAIRL
jgi:hypothetical protein